MWTPNGSPTTTSNKAFLLIVFDVQEKESLLIVFDVQETFSIRDVLVNVPKYFVLLIRPAQSGNTFFQMVCK